MLTKRVTESHKVVSLYDPALDALPESQVARYAEDRKFESLSLELCADKPSIFTVRPLRTEYEYTLTQPDQASLWVLFREHVEAIDNFDFGGKEIWEFGGRRVLRDDSRCVFTPEIVQEIGGVIVQLASRYDVRPFSQPDSWRPERRQRIRRAALSATIDGASESL